MSTESLETAYYGSVFTDKNHQRTQLLREKQQGK